MNKLREKTPVQRKSPKEVKNHTEYKQELKEDYYSRCGYCNDSDHWTGGWRFFQLDHFVPKKYLKNISVTEYTNLIYSCFFCNNSKRAKWPSKNENVPNNGKIGFVHPVTADYEEHLERDDLGNIVPKSELGAYMIKALNLDLKRHSIIWNLEQLEAIVEAIEVEYAKAGDKIPDDLKHKIPALLFATLKYSKLLRKEGNA
jgi:hypothetical protein